MFSDPMTRRLRSAARAGAMLFALACAACTREGNASVIAGGDPDRGAQDIKAMGCGSCHDIPGIAGAEGRVGPPLGGFAGRTYIAGELENTPENLERWLQDPPAIEPNTAMPNLGVTPVESRDIAAYLYSIR